MNKALNCNFRQLYGQVTSIYIDKTTIDTNYYYIYFVEMIYNPKVEIAHVLNKSTR